MPFVPFANLFPELAREETRSVSKYEAGVATRTHLFTESFCNEPGCDCRRVFILVMSDEVDRPQPRATISWGWEPDSFYRSWASFPLSKADLDELRGPGLVRLTQHGDEAEEILDEFRMLLQNEPYAARIVRHYRMFRAQIESGGAEVPTAPARNRAERRRLAKQGRKRRR